MLVMCVQSNHKFVWSTGNLFSFSICAGSFRYGLWAFIKLCTLRWLVNSIIFVWSTFHPYVYCFCDFTTSPKSSTSKKYFLMDLLCSVNVCFGNICKGLPCKFQNFFPCFPCKDNFLQENGKGTNKRKFVQYSFIR